MSCSCQPPKPETQKETEKPVYVAPRITTYTSDEILEQVGPALTCSPSPL